MKEVIVVFSMIFFHIIDDYYLQGWLASAKQKSWWKENNPNPLYKNDYKMALIEHAFSWTCMIHIPLLIYLYLNRSLFDIKITQFLKIFLSTVAWHAWIDNEKANKLRINLVIDQLSHLENIIIIWVLYMWFL